MQKCWLKVVADLLSGLELSTGTVGQGHCSHSGKVKAWYCFLTKEVNVHESELETCTGVNDVTTESSMISL